MENWKPLCTELQISEFDTYESKNYYLAKTPDGRFIKISPEIRTLLSYMNGENTIEEIVHYVNKEYNTNLTVENLENLINKELIPNNLVISPDGTLTSIRPRPSIHIPVASSRTLGKVGQIMLPLFRREIAIPILLYSFLVLSWYFARRHNLSASTSSISSISIYNNIWALFIVMFSFIIHEIGHTTASVKNQIIPESAGLGLYFFSPVFYVDVTQTWTLPPRERLLVDVGGIYFQAIFVSILTTINILFNNLILHRAILSILLLMLINLFPFIKLDGYWMLSDAIGLPNLNLCTRAIPSPKSRKK